MCRIAGLSRREFAPFFALQALRNWCWAACTQMVLAYHGIDVTQNEIVRRINGRLVDKPADDRQILEALSGWAFDFRGRRVMIESNPSIYGDEDIIQDLMNHCPLVVGLHGLRATGHLYVLTAVEFCEDERGRYCVTAFLTDPDQTSEVVMDWRELREKLGFIARVRVRSVH